MQTVVSGWQLAETLLKCMSNHLLPLASLLLLTESGPAAENNGRACETAQA